MLREALRRMGKARLIGNGPQHLIPAWQPPGTGGTGEGRRAGYKHGAQGAPAQPMRTQHTGLPRVPTRAPAGAASGRPAPSSRPDRPGRPGPAARGSRPGRKGPRS